ncbi:MAG TPA: FtsX-like permease family protein [Spongiibacteraceae bacterium]|nr:FtsX-like permease family protein [Spongiibacteraceae bacterium]
MLLWLSQWRFLSRQPVPSLLLLLGTVLAIAALTAVELLDRHSAASLARAAAQLDGEANYRLANARRDFPETVYADLRRLWLARWPGLALAPVLEGSVRVAGQRWTLVGVDPLSALQQGKLQATGSGLGSLGSGAVGRPGQVAVSATSAAGQGWVAGSAIALDDQPTSATVGALVDGLPDNWLVTDIGTAQRLLGRAGRLSHIDLAIPPDVDLAALADTLPAGLRLESTAEILRGRQSLSDAFRFNLRCLALLAFAVVGFLIYGICQAAFLRRLPSLQRLWQLGAEHRQLLGGLWLEALLLTALAALPGALLGQALGRGLARTAGASLRELYALPGGAQVPVSIAAALWPALLALLIMLACYSLCYQQYRPDRPRRAASPSLRRAGAATLIGGGLLVLAPATGAGWTMGLGGAFLGMAALLLGLLALIPEALALLWPGLERAASGWGVIGRIAVRDCRREGARTQVAVAALCLALAASSGVALMVDSFRDAFVGWLDQQLPADLFLFGATDAAETAAIAALPGVSQLTPRRFTTLSLTGKPLALTAQTTPPAHRRPALLAALADPWQRFAAGAVMISEPLARRRHLRPGDSLALPGDRGEQRFTVAGVFRDYGDEHGRVLIHLDHYHRGWQDPGQSSLAIELAPGGDGERLQGAIIDTLAALRGAEPGVRLVTRNQVRERALGIFEQTFAVTQALRLLVLCIALAGIVSSLVIYQQFRARQLATLQALGMDRRQGHRLFLTQALCISASAGLLALPLGLLVAWLLVAVINPQSFGWSFPLILSALPGLHALGLALLCGVLAALYPCWRFANAPTAASLHRD